MEWTDQVILRLRALWAEGLSTAEIGRRLGVSKNAVVGKAHRLHLSPRPSPIRPSTGIPGANRVVPASAPPPEPAAADDHAPPEPLALADTSAVVERPVERVAPRPVALVRTGRRSVECCWPLGDPGKANFRFCGAAATPGKPYCQPHAQLAYVKIRDRREDAA